MHSTIYEEGRSKFVIHHHGDHGGDCSICQINPENGDPIQEIENVPTELLRTFVANQIRMKKISDLEDATNNSLLELGE